MKTIATYMLVPLLVGTVGCSSKPSADATSETQTTQSSREDPRINAIRGLLVSESSADWSTAKQKAAAFIQTAPNEPTARILYTIALARSGDVSTAKKEANALKRDLPNDLRADATMASILLIEKDYQGSINLVAPLVLKHPNSEYLHHVLAIGYGNTGNKLKSEQHYNRVKEINPEYDGIPVSFGAFLAIIVKYGPTIANLISAAVRVATEVKKLNREMATPTQ